MRPTSAARPLLALLVLLVPLALLVASTAAHAERRFALVVGHNRGTADEERLQFADNDARRMADALRGVGDVRADDLVLMTEDSDTPLDVLAALDSLEEHARGADDDAMLIVYYSGHADSSALHFGEHKLDLATLDARLQQSPVKVRLLILDACRSGSLTRVKGDAALTAEGYVVVTAASAAEAAAESDDVQGSYFTHALVSGLRGAADDDGDGVVLLGEAFRHAYDATVLRTARAQSGLQHPTFRQELRGRSDLVLARLAVDLAYVTGPEGNDVVFSSAGRVVAELRENDERRTLALPAGRYDVVVRGADVAYEGAVDVVAGQSTFVDVTQLEGAAYAHLVRKGTAEKSVQWGIELGPVGSFAHAVGFVGAEVGVPIALRWVTITPRLAVAAASSSSSPRIPGRRDPSRTIDDLQNVRASVSAGPFLDLGPFALGASVLAGVELVTQQTQVIDAPGSVLVLEPVAGVGGFVGVAGTAQVTIDRFFVGAGVEVSASSLGDEVASPSYGLAARLALGVWL